MTVTTRHGGGGDAAVPAMHTRRQSMNAVEAPAAHEPVQVAGTTTTTPQRVPARRGRPPRRSLPILHAASTQASTAASPLPVAAAAAAAAAVPKRAPSKRWAKNEARDEEVVQGEDSSMDIDTADVSANTTATAMSYDVPPNVLDHQGLDTIPLELIDALPDVAFPQPPHSRRAASSSSSSSPYYLHEQDTADPLLLLCGHVLASVSNRALTPKEIALVLARRHNWHFAGSQPFAVVSSCIRSHVRRAMHATPPYAPIFSSYELSSVPPVDDIPCLGIQPEAKPVVKRGTFWFLSEHMGYGNPFPHRTLNSPHPAGPVALSIHSTLPGAAVLTFSGPSNSSSSSSSANTAATAAAASAPARGHLRSSSRHQQPIPIMPAPAPSASGGSSTALLATTQGAESSTGVNAGNSQQVPRRGRGRPSAAMREVQSASQLLPSHTNDQDPQSHQQQQLDPLGKGKRKRTTSTAVAVTAQQPLAGQSNVALAPADVLHPHLQPPPAGNADGQHAATSQSGSVTDRQTRTSHRRASSSSVGDLGAPLSHTTADAAASVAGSRPVPALRKLKLRLSAVSENGALQTPMASTSTSQYIPYANASAQQQHQHQQQLSASMPASSSSGFVRPAKPRKSASSGSSRSHKSKRQRTQSMSQFSTTTASFPFNDLHLHYSTQNIPSLHNAPTFHHDNGTLAPAHMHMNSMLSSPAGSGNALDLLTSRSAPENNVFSPGFARGGQGGSRPGTPGGGHAAFNFVAGPFSRSHSPSMSISKHGRRSLPPENGHQQSRDTPAVEYDGWGTEEDRAPLRQQFVNGEHASVQGVDFHEAMLKNDVDLALDYSLDNLREEGLMQSIDENGEHGPEGQHGLRGSSSALLEADINGVFDGLDESGNSNETVRDRRRSSFRSSAEDLDVEMSLFEEDEDQEQDGAGDSQNDGAQRDGSAPASASASPARQDRRQSFHKALQTTLCPAAAKFANETKPSRILAKRMDSSSSLTFARLAHGVSRPSTPVLRPALHRTPSDALSTPVPLADLPSIPLDSNRKNPFDMYHFTSEADSTHDRSARLAAHDNDETDDSASYSDGTRSSRLTPVVVKSEEEIDEMSESLQTTRSSSSSESVHRSSSSDSFVADMIYPVRSRSECEVEHSSALGIIVDPKKMQEQSNSRSQSSSRTTSLSPRDSFSPQNVGPHGTAVDADPDWALTPPSEEEHTDDEEKNLDRAAMFGLESVGMDDLDALWPGARRTITNLQQRVEGVITGLKVMEVFEPILSPAPIPHVDLPQPSFLSPPLLPSGSARDGQDSSTGEDMPMQTDTTVLDEHTAATMFIADESLYPPKPETSLSPVTAAVQDASATASLQIATRQAGLSGPEEAIVMPPAAPSSEPASTQSFLFWPEKPYDPEITILLTDTKLLFYSTVVKVWNNGRPLLRRVDNDAVDAEALLASLEGASNKDGERVETLKKIKELGNTWVSLEFARELLKKFGGAEPPLATFLADDILLSWNDKLQRLGNAMKKGKGGKTSEAANKQPGSSARRSTSAQAEQSKPSPARSRKTSVKTEFTAGSSDPSVSSPPTSSVKRATTSQRRKSVSRAAADTSQDTAIDADEIEPSTSKTGKNFTSLSSRRASSRNKTGGS